jgi:hypothetical protein
MKSSDNYIEKILIVQCEETYARISKYVLTLSRAIRLYDIKNAIAHKDIADLEMTQNGCL